MEQTDKICGGVDWPDEMNQFPVFGLYDVDREKRRRKQKILMRIARNKGLGVRQRSRDQDDEVTDGER